MARRAHELGGLERGDRPRPRGVRQARRHGAGARRDRRDRVRPRRPRRRLAAGRQRASWSRRSSSPRPCSRSSSSRGSRSRPCPPARLAEAIDERTDVVAFSAVQMSTGEVADVDAILAAAAAHDVLTLVDATPGRGLAAARRPTASTSSSRRLQVADLAARDGVDDRRARAPRRDRAVAGGLVRGRGRPTRPTSARRCGSPTTRAGSTPPPPGSPGSAPCRRWSCSTRSASRRSTSTTSALANRFRAAMGLEPSNSAIVSVEWPGGVQRCAPRASRPRSPADRLRVASTSTTTKRTPTARSTSSPKVAAARRVNAWQAKALWA